MMIFDVWRVRDWSRKGGHRKNSPLTRPQRRLTPDPTQASCRRFLTALDLRNEEHLRPGRDRLEIAGLVDRPVDRDGGLLLQVLAQPRKQPVHLADDPAQVLRLHL